MVLTKVQISFQEDMRAFAYDELLKAEEAKYEEHKEPANESTR